MAAVVSITEACGLRVRFTNCRRSNADALQQSRQGSHSTVQHSHQLAEVAVPPIAATLASDCRECSIDYARRIVTHGADERVRSSYSISQLPHEYRLNLGVPRPAMPRACYLLADDIDLGSSTMKNQSK